MPGTTLGKIIAVIPLIGWIPIFYIAFKNFLNLGHPNNDEHNNRREDK